jgi:hypothetical protein
MARHRRELDKTRVDFSKVLNEKLRNAGIDEVDVSAGSIDVPNGHLAVILTLSSPTSLPIERRKAERIANEESIKYIQDRRKTAK